MTTPNKTRLSVEGISEEAVAHFLQTHPEFFERHSRLLAQLRLPHQVSGSAISLIERQVDILRERNRKLERKLRELVEVARANDSLAQKIHTLAHDLIGLSERASVMEVVEQALRLEFGADQSVLVLFDNGEAGSAEPPGRFLRRVRRDDPAIKAFDTFMSNGRSRCGQIRDAQRDFLFGEETNEIGSAALVPLGKECEIGLLAIGSHDANHFHPTKSTDFLSRLGTLVSRALAG